MELDAFGGGGTLDAVQQTARQVQEAGFAALWMLLKCRVGN